MLTFAKLCVALPGMIFGLELSLQPVFSANVLPRWLESRARRRSPEPGNRDRSRSPLRAGDARDRDRDRDRDHGQDKQVIRLRIRNFKGLNSNFKSARNQF